MKYLTALPISFMWVVLFSSSFHFEITHLILSSVYLSSLLFPVVSSSSSVFPLVLYWFSVVER